MAAVVATEATAAAAPAVVAPGGAAAAPGGAATALTSATFLEEEIKGFQQQIVNIAGEMVAFTPTGFPKGEPSIVQFDDYYKPEGMSLSDAMILKNALRQLFGSASLPVYDTKLGKELPRTISLPILPPCDEIQKTLVMRSLQYRFDLLRQELNVRGIRSYTDMRKRMEELKRNGTIASLEGQDTLDVRRNLQHFQALKQLMEKYEKAQQCFNLEDKAFGALELDLTDERARELLKQFIFFTLQAHHPLQDYKKTNPTAPAFIKRLEVNPLGETFPKFMTTYKGNKLPIPESIARVLESIGAEPGMMDAELKRRLEEAFAKEKDKILTYVYGFFPPGDPFWRTIGAEKDVYRIVEKLMERLKEAEGEVDRITAENEALKEKIRACESAKDTLQENVRRLTAQVGNLTTQLEAAGGKDEEIKRLNAALAAANAENLAKQREHEAKILELQGKLDFNIRFVATLKERVTKLLAENGALQAQVDRLRAAEDAAKKDFEGVLRGYETRLTEERARTTAETAAKTKATEARDAAVAELASVKAEIVGKDETLRANKEQIDALTKAVNDCKADSERLSQELAAKNEEAEGLLREKTELGRQIQANEASIAELTTKFEESEGQKDELRAEIERLNETIKQLRAELADKDAAWKKCEAEKVAMTEPADALARKAAGLEGELAAARSKADALEAERARLAAQVTSLQADVAQRDGVVAELRGELSEQEDELEEITGRATAAEGDRDSARAALGEATTALDEQRGLVARQRDELLARDENHARQIGELTETFKGQLAAEAGKTAEETKRAELAEAAMHEQEAVVREKDAALSEKDAALSEKDAALSEKDAALSEKDAALSEKDAALREQSNAYELLKRAIVALVEMDASNPGVVEEAIDPVTEPDTKGNLKALYGKLMSLMTSSSSSRAEEKAAEHMASQCQNVLLLSFLWQTNFSTTDPESQTVYAMLNTVFSSGPYPGKPALKLPGVYDGNPLNAKIYLPLLKKLLTLFDLGSPVAEGSVLGMNVTAEEMANLKKVLNALSVIDEAYKGVLLAKAMENMRKHQPNIAPHLPSDTLNLDEGSLRVERTLRATGGTRLSYPVVFYSFMIVLRDVLNQSSTSLSRGGQCPLPQILTLPAPRRGSLLSTLD